MEGPIVHGEVTAASRRQLKQRGGGIKVKVVGDSTLTSADTEEIARAFAHLSPARPPAPAGKASPERFHDMSPRLPHLSAGRSISSGVPMTAVQHLYELCKATFVGNAVPAVPPATDLQQVRRVLNSMKPSDVGLDGFGVSEGLRGFAQHSNGRRGGRYSTGPKFSPPITYLHLYECSAFSMGIFCLPTSAVIPLHNHPGMTVLSKLLHGSMHVRAFDWLNPYDETSSPAQPRLAKRVIDEVMSAPCEATALFPTSGGNIHAFTALTPCAILDVLAPPYCGKSGRHCTYYHEVSPNGGHSNRRKGHQNRGVIDAQSKELGWLEPYDPEGMLLQSGIYTGPKVIPS